MGPGTYNWAPAGYDPRAELTSVARRMDPSAAFSGPTAAWLHGLDLPPCLPIEVTVPLGMGVSGLAGVRLRRARLDPGEVVEARGFPVTSKLRTLADLGGRKPLADAVVAIDMGLHAGLAEVSQLQAYADTRVARKGVRQLRYALALADAATESPMETRLRLLLVGAGLPRPEAQATIRSPSGRFIARVDFLYRSDRLVIEFDGATHRDSIVPDARRHNELIAAAYTVLRFTTADVLGRPNLVLAQVIAGLAA